jgi:hypothetical protein
MVLLGIAIALVMLSVVGSAYAQSKYVNLTMDNSVLIPYGKLIVETQKYLDKLTLMEGTCGDRLADRSDFSILPACTKFHEGFNQHMRDFFNETRDEMTKVLVD